MKHIFTLALLTLLITGCSFQWLDAPATDPLDSIVVTPQPKIPTLNLDIDIFGTWLVGDGNMQIEFTEDAIYTFGVRTDGSEYEFQNSYAIVSERSMWVIDDGNIVTAGFVFTDIYEDVTGLHAVLAVINPTTGEKQFTLFLSKPNKGLSA